MQQGQHLAVVLDQPEATMAKDGGFRIEVDGSDDLGVGDASHMLAGAPNGDGEIEARGHFATSLPDNIKEISICTVGAHYRAKFEFYAHAPLALAAGVDPAVVEAIRKGERPSPSNPSEQAAYQLTQALLDRHGWTDEEYAAGRAVFTEQELVELVTVVGYYCQISLTLNAFRVALPPGSADPFP